MSKKTFADILIELRGKKERTIAAAGIGISRTALINYETGKRKPDIDILEKIANYYKVSADYLLGRTDVKTQDMSLRQVSEITGLSENAIQLIQEWNNDDSHRYLADYISQFIEDKESNDFFTELCAIMGNATLTAKYINKSINISDLRNQYIASLWYLSHHMTNIIERVYIARFDGEMMSESYPNYTQNQMNDDSIG